MVRSSRPIPVLASTGALMLAAVGCHLPARAPAQPQRAMMPMPAPAPAPATRPMPITSLQPTEPAMPAPIVLKDVGLQTPECVLWDGDQDVYFVSNINGQPTAADKN